jgi:ABC-type nitrate/sulfonate/bicarbonate transport system ATPase subunit
MQTISEAAYSIYQSNATFCILTGKAGTGKTTLLREIIATTHKKPVVVAPTGIALNAGGVTIHSCFSCLWWIYSCVWLTLNSQTQLNSLKIMRRHFKMSGLRNR